MFCEQVWRTRQSVFRAGRAPSVKLQALPHVTFVPGTLTLEREPVRVHIAPRHSIPVRMQTNHSSYMTYFSMNQTQSSN